MRKDREKATITIRLSSDDIDFLIDQELYDKCEYLQSGLYHITSSIFSLLLEQSKDED